MNAFQGRRAVHALLATTVLCGLAAPATAQMAGHPAPRELIDGNGVDLFRGNFTVDETIASVGAAQGLSLRRISRGSSEFMYNVDAYISGTSTVYVTVNGRTDRFTMSGSTYIPTEGNGSALTFSNNIYTYTARDGTVVAFNKALLPPGYHPYGSEGVVTSITEPDGASLAMTYEQSNLYCEYYNGDLCAGQWMRSRRLTSVSSGYGYSINFSYAADSIEDGSQVMPWYEITSRTLHNGATPVAGDTNPNHLINGYVTTSGKITGVRRPGSASNDITVAYDAAGKVYTITDHSGATTYTYADLSGVRTVTVTNPLNEVNTYTFNIASERMTKFRDALNNETTYTYDGSARLTRITKPEGNYTNFTYDARGNVTQTLNHAKTGSSDPDIVTSAVFPATCTNVACNQPTSTTDARGNVTDYTYNTTHGSLLTVTAPAPTVGAVRPKQTFNYVTQSGVTLPQSVSQCTTLASCAGTADEVKTSVTYGANLLPTQVSSGNGTGTLTATTSLAYDPTGNLVTVDGPLVGADDTTTAIYDGKRRVIGTISPDPDGAGSRPRLAERNTFATNGDLTKVERGTVVGTTAADLTAMTVAQGTDFAYDADGQKIRETLTGGGLSQTVTQYSYDNAGRLTCSAQRMDPADWGALPPSACTITTPDGPNGPDRITKSVRDLNGRPTQVQVAVGTAALANERTLTFSNNGQLLTLTDGENNKTSYEYDGHDRLVKTLFPMPTKGALASNASDYEQLTLDPNGNVASRRLRDTQAIAFTYDALNRPTLKNLPGSEPDVSYAYDNLGRLTSTSQTGHSLSFTYDALSRNLTQAGPLGTASSAWDLAGRRTRLTYPGSGLFVDTDYDLLGNVTAIRENGATTGVEVLATYAYDNLSRRTAVTFGNGVAQSFTYDSASRIATQTNNLTGTANDLTATFVYNPASQINSVTRSKDAYAWTGAYAVNRDYTSNGLNQLTLSGTVTPTYDGRGNLTSAGGPTYGYNSENRLTSATSGVSLAYDPLLRLYQTTGTSTARMAYDGLDLIAEYDGTSALLRRYVHGPGIDNPIVWYEGSGTATRRFLSSDERGSIIAATDSVGAVVGVNSYDEYGIPAASNIGRFGYTGQTWLGDLGMWNYKNRIYSPTLGRFLQTDPIGYGDGLNVYAYVANDPVNWVDPLGLTGISCDEGRVDGYISGPGGPVYPTVHLDGTGGSGGWCSSNFGALLRTGGWGGIGGGEGGGGGSDPSEREEEPPSVAECLVQSGRANGVNLALDAAGAALVLASAKFQLAAAIGGSIIGTVGIGVSIANKDPAGVGLAYGGKTASSAGGIGNAGSALVRGATRFGAAFVAASSARDLAKAYSDFQECRAGR